MTEKNALNDATPYIPGIRLGKPEPELSILRYSEYEIASFPRKEAVPLLAEFAL
jgi:hypothetical protein